MPMVMKHPEPVQDVFSVPTSQEDLRTKQCLILKQLSTKCMWYRLIIE